MPEYLSEQWRSRPVEKSSSMPYAWNVAREKYRAQRESSHCLSARRVAKYAGIRRVGGRTRRPSFLVSFKPVSRDFRKKIHRRIPSLIQEALF